MMPLYRNFSTQEEIDREYSPRLAIGEDRANQYIARFAEEGRRVRAAVPHMDEVPFGPSAAEHVDVYPAKTKGAPVHVFIHGGYWRAFTSKDFAFVAEAFHVRDVAAVLVNYALCPEVTVGEIVRQCREAVAWTWRRAAEFHADPSRLTVSGHSAGGHLTAMMLATDWTKHGLPADAIKAACPISGLFDLGPFPHSFLQPQLKLDDRQVAEQSPLRHPVRARCPVLVAVGGDESAEFHRQSEEYVAHAKAHGLETRYLDVPGKDHFSVLEDFSAPGRPLFEAFSKLL
jgi:arylformamidase